MPKPALYCQDGPLIGRQIYTEGANIEIGDVLEIVVPESCWRKSRYGVHWQQPCTTYLYKTVGEGKLVFVG